ncbi:hypothetical protein PR048_000045 [Dryococelus australis]|uniref:Uncharacterized protein n=1 Tax=Dryococelus australis TaxID=614101 RepID=A0ABQ9IDJ1_9NEOP|nr:hypothetical protein PR048_000045 [Dryococelus australis]
MVCQQSPIPRPRERQCSLCCYLPDLYSIYHDFTILQHVEVVEYTRDNMPRSSIGTHFPEKISAQGATMAERLACSPPFKTIRIQSPAGPHRIFLCGNRAGRCRRSAGFLGDIPEDKPSKVDRCEEFPRVNTAAATNVTCLDLVATHTRTQDTSNYAQLSPPRILRPRPTSPGLSTPSDYYFTNLGKGTSLEAGELYPANRGGLTVESLSGRLPLLPTTSEIQKPVSLYPANRGGLTVESLSGRLPLLPTTSEIQKPVSYTPPIAVVSQSRAYPVVFRSSPRPARSRSRPSIVQDTRAFVSHSARGWSSAPTDAQSMWNLEAVAAWLLTVNDALRDQESSYNSSYFGCISSELCGENHRGGWCTPLPWSDYLPPTHQGSIPGRATPDFRTWESFRTMLLVGGFSWGSPSLHIICVRTPEKEARSQYFFIHARSSPSLIGRVPLSKTDWTNENHLTAALNDYVIGRQIAKTRSNVNHPVAIVSLRNSFRRKSGVPTDAYQFNRVIALVCGFSRGSVSRPFHSRAAPYSPHFTLIGSQDLRVKSRPNLPTSNFTSVSTMDVYVCRFIAVIGHRPFEKLSSGSSAAAPESTLINLQIITARRAEAEVWHVLRAVVRAEVWHVLRAVVRHSAGHIAVKEVKAIHEVEKVMCILKPSFTLQKIIFLASNMAGCQSKPGDLQSARHKPISGLIHHYITRQRHWGSDTRGSDTRGLTLGAVTLEAVTLEAVTQGAVTLEAVTLDVVTLEAVTLEAVTLGAVTLETVTQGAVTLGIVTLAGVTLGAVTFREKISC